MQDGSRLLLSLIDSGKKGFTTFMDLQLDEAMFRGTESDLYEFVREHIMSYGKLPERATVEQWGEDSQNSIPKKKSLVEPPQYYHDRVQHRNMRLYLKNALINAQDTINDDAPFEALQELMTEIVRLSNTTRATKLVNFSEVGGKIIKDETAKVLHPDTEYGLRFGWDSFDKMSGGLIGGDVVSFVGRPSLGKTFMMLFAAIRAWKDGKVPLFVSMEMKTTPIVQRLAALITKTSITEIKKASVGGTVGGQQGKYEKMLHELYGMKKKHDFWVADGALSATPEDILMLCKQLRPDVLFIDGAYLLQNSNTKLPRWDRISTNAETIKSQLAEGLNLPVVVSYQLNRETTKKKTKDVGVENIAYSDSIGQLSSVVLGLFEEESVETKLQRKVRILKGRNGEQGEFTINWKFGGMGKPVDGEHDTHDVMNFEEIVDEYTKLNEKYVG